MVERRIGDRKVLGSSPGWSVGRIFFSGIWGSEPVERMKQRSDVVAFNVVVVFCLVLVCGEQHSSECEEGYVQRKQAGQNGKNCSSRGVTERGR